LIRRPDTDNVVIIVAPERQIEIVCETEPALGFGVRDEEISEVNYGVMETPCDKIIRAWDIHIRQCYDGHICLKN
jgi:hypothetical protein